MWGYSKVEVMGQNVKMLVAAEFQADHDDLVNRNRRTGEDKIVGLSRDIEITRKDGSVFWGNLSLSKVRVGGEIHYTAFVIDITEQKQAQEIINQTLEQALDAVVTIDSENRVTFFNGSAEKLWGYHRSEVLGKNVKMLVPVEHQSMHDAYVNGNRTTGENKIVGTSREVQVERKDGSTLDVNLSLSKVLVGDEILYTAFVKDITEEVSKRMELRRLSLVANKTSNSVVVCDSKGRIERVNEGFHKLTGYDFDDVVGKKPGSMLQGPHTDQATVQRIRESLNRGESFYEEVLNYTKSGVPYWIALSVNPIKDEMGKVVRFVSIQAEIHDTKTSTLENDIRLEAIARTNLVVDWSPEGDFLTSNELFYRIMGRTDPEGIRASGLVLKGCISGEEMDRLQKGEAIR